MKQDLLSDEDVREMLREIAGPRGVAKWCREKGVTESFATTFLCGDRPPGPTLLKAMGLKKGYARDVSLLQSPAETR